METNLVSLKLFSITLIAIVLQDYLRELLQLFVPSFYLHLCTIGGDALHLMFVHRWILLFFKREFPEIDALHIWEVRIFKF